ncbi:uncharacterized protein LOC105695437 [Orussus abietinus]|uniref:uncharacterized protein LOC105695437 n=1 Tax=Orussus abietinus TaxID=222816 RepID=UPI000C715F5A|nr:uncharacterized protein LOC105695437 [Orussus abietinus]
MHETFRRFNEELERSEPDISLFSPRRAFRMSNGTQTNIDASNLISSNNEFFKVPDVPMPDQQLEQNIEIRLPEEEARTPRKRKSVVVPEPLTPSKRLNLEEVRIYVKTI